jgi:adenosylcobinamide-GDP ribazoletransferase
MMGLNPVLLAMQFLTRIPVRVDAPAARQISASYFFYPLVGAAVGGAAVLVRRLCGTVFPESLSIAVTLAFVVWLTGGLHEDGLSDVADGMGAGWTPERRLAIMKDSHIGAYGTLAIVFAALIKYAALTGLDRSQTDLALVTAHVLGRWAFLPMGYFNSPARGGLGSAFMKGLTLGSVLAATLVVVTALMMIHGTKGLRYVLFASLVVLGASAYFRKYIGGVTGDCFGATFQIVEIGTYALFFP